MRVRQLWSTRYGCVWAKCGARVMGACGPSVEHVLRVWPMCGAQLRVRVGQVWSTRYGGVWAKFGDALQVWAKCDTDEREGESVQGREGVDSMHTCGHGRMHT
eukprot:350189-Chlamydomonas_euryale.AAC.4